MTQQEQLVAALKKEAAGNKAFNDACHVFALRKRARAGVTLGALSRRMEKEGFNYTKEDYISILRTLARLGLGRLDTDAKGRVRALKEVKTTLQSIGKAACENVTDLENYRQRNRFSKIKAKRHYQSEIPTPTAAPVSANPGEVGFGIFVNGKAVRLNGIEALSPQEVKDLIVRLSDLGVAK